MENASRFGLTGRPSLLSSCHLRFQIHCPSDFLEMKQMGGWTLHICLAVAIICISRGNKGTTFVLQKKTDLRQRLLSSTSTDTGVKEIIDELISLNQNEFEGEQEALVGEWQSIWSPQMEAESWLHVAANCLQEMLTTKSE